MNNSNEAAFLDFVDAQGRGLRGLAQALTGNEHDAADLYQETLIKLLRSWSKVRDSGAAVRYARTVMTRHYISSRRRPWERRAVLQDPPEPDTVHEIDDIDSFIAMRSALEKLSRRQRAVIALRFYCDLPEAEIAVQLRCSPGTVKTHTARALSRLRNDPSLTATFGSTHG